MGDTSGAASAVTTMKVDPSRAAALVANLQAVKERLAAAAGGRDVRLVAVSKLKPANDVLALHQAPASQLHFGENYAQELRDKAALLPQTIQWHFIGGLQSTHCKTLARIPNLWAVSSIDSAKKAKMLDKARDAFLKESPPAAGKDGRINVHVQVNTSGEANKSGCNPGDETIELCRFIVEECPRLHFLGLMTIGAIARSRAIEVTEDGENPDFVALREQRDAVGKWLISSGKAAAGQQNPADILELSMGMSDDFESAAASGSGEVRVGSTLFGQRPAKADAKLTV